ncbi:GT-D fold domain-containing glycosyltransferase [Butyrivibrio sp. MC2021]|uniref:GT-D fold domain-containing glycosyltransferase n=1 Tax=Butyrivibrio sp. MC2021 TaxID=1408306 RepID=UPI0004786DB6|nr:GT-D fold domain-containing glycosyltransferase [Butyrivibrio sp. MC2021]
MDNSYKRILDELISENARLNDCQVQSNKIMAQMMDYIENLSKELEQTKSLVYVNRSQILSLPYELADPDYVSPVFKPRFYSASETRRLVSEGKSIGRLGDGEFAAIAGEKRWNFQDVSKRLGEKIKETLESDDEEFLVGLNPTFYSNLLDLPEAAANGVRAYMVPDVRRFHASLLKKEKIYADALMCDINSETDVSEIKQIWNDKEVVFIEGRYTRMGVGNDLFDNCRSIERILAPSQNAVDKYDDIMTEALKQPKNKLILLALGPTATALSYDLFKEGYHAVDIGHLDLRYEQFIRNLKLLYNVDIPYKYCNKDEVGELRDIPDPDDNTYEQQIVAKVY